MIHQPNSSRRAFLQASTASLSSLAFTALAADDSNPTQSPHHAPKAKRVIFLCMEGAPSHVDTFDYKPQLYKSDGQSFGVGRAAGTLRAPLTPFSQHGQSGLWISDLLPNIAKHADDLTVINSMHTDLPAHAQAFLKMHTGNSQFSRPSLGAWSVFGLGSQNENLPGFISIAPPSKNGGAANYASAFLPAMYQATPIGKSGRSIQNATVTNLTNNRKSDKAQRLQLDLLQSMNQTQLNQQKINPQIQGLIESYELAFRMQTQMPDLLNLNNESQTTLDSYGVDNPATDDFARQCLLARRLSQAGVRFIEICAPNWDHHTQLSTRLPESCAAVDQPIAALLADLKQRGLLNDTLVIFAGEFGRTPYAQGSDGRDHNNKGYTLWMAGGGLKSGIAYGQTDDIGHEAVQNKVPIHDWHATILHLLGLNHEKLTYRYAGRDFRLTDTSGQILNEIIA